MDAVMDSGLRKTVFVDRGEGHFEPRQIETGARLGDRIVIASGVKEGERIVVSGNFLIDSESRLKLAAAAKDPVCGMDVEPSKTPANRKLAIDGKIYYFCSDHCKQQFEKQRGPA
jgi:YHS domain-containing protein